jgi:hypothetical protein
MEHQLTARTFDVISGAQVAQRMVAAPPAASTSKSTTITKPSYGASRGRQIPIQLNNGDSSVTGAPQNTVSSSAPLPTANAAPSDPIPRSDVTMATSAGNPPGEAGTKRKLDQIQM